ncbi:MAG TPA: hypothetical protein VMU94_06630 [Streptosporangiaceae bacterium]|nr:hypothetical protein [Streptosporangiaceae bacterium]
MKLTIRLSRRLAVGAGRASAAILLPTAALASSAVACIRRVIASRHGTSQPPVRTGLHLHAHQGLVRRAG